MKKTVIGVFTLWVLFFAASPALAQLKKIRFSTTSIAVTELQFRIAQLKGFYRDEGLDLETILIRGAVGMQALLGGSVDYSSAAGALIAAAVRGAPVRLVLIVNAKPQFELVAQPEIKAIPQLKGKLIGISSRGGAVDLLTQMILTQNGLTPNKDTTLLVIGTPEEMALALRTGRIAACLLTPPRQLMLYREGFTKLAYSGDYLSTYPVGRRRGDGRKDQNPSVRSFLLCQSRPEGAPFLYAESRRVHRDHVEASWHQRPIIGRGGL